MNTFINFFNINYFFDIYEEFLSILSFNLKKTFKNWRFVLPIFLGIVFGILLFSKLIDFLYGNSEKMEADYVIVSSSETPELYALVTLLKEKHGMERRLLAYAQKLMEEK